MSNRQKLYEYPPPSARMGAGGEWSTGIQLLYIHDENGSVIGLGYRETSYVAGDYDYFFFDKNIFGDIIAIYNESGECIGTYIYDAWGNFEAYATRARASPPTAAPLYKKTAPLPQ